MDEVNFLETFSAAREDGLERLSTLLYHVTSWLDSEWAVLHGCLTHATSA